MLAGLLSLGGVTAVTAAPANGNVSLNANGTFSYTPNAGFSGTDSFGYRVSDGQGRSSPTCP